MTRRALAVALALLAAHALAAQAPTLAGRVLARDGSRAAGARIVLRWRQAPELPGLCGISLGDAGLGELAATADARGGFSVPLPHRGPFEVRAELGADRSTPRFPVMAGAFVELQLAEPTLVAGVVSSADDTPVAERAIRFVPEATAWSKLAAYRLPEWRGSARTDAQGRFQLPFHDAYSRTPRWEAFAVLDVDAPGLAAKNLELLRPTQHCRELALRLVPAAEAHPRAPGSTRPSATPAPVPIGSRRVCARLRDGDRAIAAAPVLWSRPRSDGAPLESAAITDANGAVAIADVAAGSTLLGFVELGGRWLPFARAAIANEGTDDIDLGVVTVAARSLAGQVLDAEGTPVPDARVAVLARNAFAGELPYVTYTDHGGRYELAALPPGPLRIWADCGRHGFASAQVDAQRTCDLRTPAAGEIVGTVVDGDGVPFANACLVIVRQGNDPDLMPGLRPGSTHLVVLSDADGKVHLRGMPEGSWQIIGNAVREGRLFGGGTNAVTGGSFDLALRTMRE